MGKKLSKKEKIPDWLPDGENLADYPDKDRATNKQWAWEFLRRNPQYQEMHSEYFPTDDTYLPFGKANETFKSHFGINFPLKPSVSTAPSGFRFNGTIAAQLILQSHPNSFLDMMKPRPYKNEFLARINYAIPLEPQLKAIRQTAERYRKEEGIPKIIKRPSWKYHMYLRILDALSHGKGNEALEKIVGSRAYRNRGEPIERAKAAAYNFRDVGYLIIARS